jgi:hypothetical protein
MSWEQGAYPGPFILRSMPQACHPEEPCFSGDEGSQQFRPFDTYPILTTFVFNNIPGLNR